MHSIFFEILRSVFSQFHKFWVMAVFGFTCDIIRYNNTNGLPNNMEFWQNQLLTPQRSMTFMAKRLAMWALNYKVTLVRLSVGLILETFFSKLVLIWVFWLVSGVYFITLVLIVQEILYFETRLLVWLSGFVYLDVIQYNLLTLRISTSIKKHCGQVGNWCGCLGQLLL